MAAGEAGADYVMFGEPERRRRADARSDAASALAGGPRFSRRRASPTPHRLEDVAALVAAGADFIALGEAVWERRPTRGGGARGDAGGGGAMTIRFGAGAALLAGAERRARTPSIRTRRCSRRRSSRQIGPDAPLKPKPGDPPGDIAFGAYQRGYYITALREAEKRLAANSEDAAAMTLIGEIYHDGFAVKRDDEEAARWWRLAANAGDPQAAYEYGVALLTGAGVPEDKAAAQAQFAKAAAEGQSRRALQSRRAGAEGRSRTANPISPPPPQYFRHAAEAGDGNAAYSYGVLLREGKGVALDTDAAAEWLKRAADDGIIAGQVEYAIMLFNGVGVTKDEAAAAKIFRPRRRAAQSDRAEPARASLSHRPRRAERPGARRAVERPRADGGAQGRQAR